MTLPDPIPQDLLQPIRDGEGRTVIEGMKTKDLLDLHDKLVKLVQVEERRVGDAEMASMILSVLGIDAGKEAMAAANAHRDLHKALLRESKRVRAMLDERLSNG